jgi:transcriptional regulator with XRE-family HTH domain
VSALSSLFDKFTKSRKYRESFAASVVKRMIPLQIKALRKQRDWSQAQLATEAKLTQGVISRAEDPDYGNLTVNTLVRVGAGFDCAFVGRFVPFSELARWYENVNDEKMLEVASFDNDTGFATSIDRLGPTSEAMNSHRKQATGTTGVKASQEYLAGSRSSSSLVSTGSTVVSIMDARKISAGIFEAKSQPQARL